MVRSVTSVKLLVCSSSLGKIARLPPCMDGQEISTDVKVALVATGKSVATQQVKRSATFTH